MYKTRKRGAQAATTDRYRRVPVTCSRHNWHWWKNNRQKPIATGKEWRNVCGQSLGYWEDHFMASMNSCCMSWLHSWIQKLSSDEPRNASWTSGKSWTLDWKTRHFLEEGLEPGLKLAITLRYLATGNSYKSLQYGFRVSFSAISLLILEVFEAIIEECWRSAVMSSNRRGMETYFWAVCCKWNFRHCVGAIDGKHVAIRCTVKAGSVYFNYNGFHSIVLMALVDADYMATLFLKFAFFFLVALV